MPPRYRGVLALQLEELGTGRPTFLAELSAYSWERRWSATSRLSCDGVRDAGNQTGCRLKQLIAEPRPASGRPLTPLEHLASWIGVCPPGRRARWRIEKGPLPEG